MSDWTSAKDTYVIGAVILLLWLTAQWWRYKQYRKEKKDYTDALHKNTAVLKHIEDYLKRK